MLAGGEWNLEGSELPAGVFVAAAVAVAVEAGEGVFFAVAEAGVTDGGDGFAVLAGFEVFVLNETVGEGE